MGHPRTIQILRDQLVILIGHYSSLPTTWRRGCAVAPSGLSPRRPRSPPPRPTPAGCGNIVSSPQRLGPYATPHHLLPLFHAAPALEHPTTTRHSLRLELSLFTVGEPRPIVMLSFLPPWSRRHARARARDADSLRAECHVPRQIGAGLVALPARTAKRSAARCVLRFLERAGSAATYVIVRDKRGTSPGTNFFPFLTVPQNRTSCHYIFRDTDATRRCPPGQRSVLEIPAPQHAPTEFPVAVALAASSARASSLSVRRSFWPHRLAAINTRACSLFNVQVFLHAALASHSHSQKYPRVLPF
ncbi:hypothetical protein DFH09DRAFT_1401120 [Mycena vulgaris]|nr:hypothetical protein DFH09DRAFT_1401120 [Mycena vulgaris]